jgi:dTDP-4-dehydrorhamnose 3,5-epimerase
MKVTATNIPDVLLVHSPVYSDSRGFFTEVFRGDMFAQAGLPTEFVQDNHSRSARHVLRGLHYQLQQPQGKLVRAVSGIIFDVAVDMRQASATFGQWVGTRMEAGDGLQLWIPPGFAHGFVVLSEQADVSYKCTAIYHPASECTLRWNDPDVGIDWPLPPGVEPLLSPKDAVAHALGSASRFA